VGGQAALYGLADVLSRGSAILLVPLYTGYMSPAEYGILGVASMATSLLTMVLSFGGQSVVMRFYHQPLSSGEKARFLGAFWLFLIAVPAVVLCALYALALTLGAMLVPGLSLRPYLELILGISYLTIAFGTVLPSLLRAREEARHYLLISLLTLLLTGGCSIYFVALLEMGAAGALAAQLAALLVVSAITSVMLLRHVAIGWRRASLRQALNYGLPLLPHFAAHWTLSISDRAIVGRFAGLTELGAYTLAYQFGTLLQLLVSGVNQALMPTFSRAANQMSEREKLGRLATYYYLIVAFLALAFALTAPDLVALLAPQAYGGAADLVPYIALGIAAMGVYFVPMNALSLTAGQTRLIPLLTLVAGVSNVMLNLIFVPRYGALAAAVNTAIGYSILAVLTAVYATRVIRIDYELTRIAKLVAAALLLYIIGASVHLDPPLFSLAIKCGIASSLPFILWCTAFWTSEEQAGTVQTLTRTAHRLRTILPGP
jgi:O-antigen/teichoic acid export membrane protein